MATAFWQASWYLDINANMSSLIRPLHPQVGNSGAIDEIKSAIVPS